MKWPKSIKQINWQYALGEIFLIFVGINLAIWFNNWNSSKQRYHAKQAAMAKITEEIKGNLIELDSAHQKTLHTSEALAALKQMYKKGTGEDIVSKPIRMRQFQDKYPNFYQITDSSLMQNGEYLYNGKVYILFEIAELTEIAWETTKTIDVLNEFDYDCLYNLESIYILQRRTQDEINKATNALQKRDLKDLQRVMEFLKQFESQLITDYRGMLDNIEDCY